MTSPAAAALPAHVTMIDATQGSARNIPVATPKVAGYVTGSPDIQWQLATWRMFPRSGHVRIDQRAGIGVPLLSDAGDAETGAKTVPDLVRRARVRHQHGLSDSWYFSRGRLDGEVIPAVRAAGLDPSRIFLWLADWSLSEAGAALLIGQKFGGMTCAAVQWASPSSNPGTIVPGSGMTLRQANVDLSVAATAWHGAANVTWTAQAAAAAAAAERSAGQAYQLLIAHGG